MSNPGRNAWAGDTGTHPTKGASYFRSAVVVDFVSNPVAYLSQNIELGKFKGTMREALAGKSADDKNGYVKTPWELNITSHGIINQMPRNSIIARPIQPGGVAARYPEIFFPFFPPHISLPVSAGEHVWIMYDGSMGYWICRKSGVLQVDDLNYTHLDRQKLTMGYSKNPEKDPLDLKVKIDKQSGNWPFTFNDGGQGTADRNTMIGENEYEKILVSSLSYATDFTGEAVPRFSKRSSDLILQGANNTLISLGQEIGTGDSTDISSLRGSPKTKGLDRSAFDSFKSIKDGLSVGDKSYDTLKSPEIDSLESSQGMGAIDIVVGRGRKETTAPFGHDPSKLNENNLGKRPATYSYLEHEETNKAPERTDLKASNPNEGNPDFINDLSRIYLSMKSRIDLDLGIDENISLSNVYGKSEDILSESDKPAILLRTDQARIMAREDLKITVGEGGAAVVIKASGDIIFIPGPAGFIKLGGSSADRAILCTGVPASQAGGSTTGTAPIGNTSAGQFGDLAAVTGISGGGLEVFGSFASKVLVVGNN